MLVWRFGIESISNPIIDSFLYSHHSSDWYCTDNSKEKFCLGHSQELMGVKTEREAVKSSKLRL